MVTALLDSLPNANFLLILKLRDFVPFDRPSHFLSLTMFTCRNLAGTGSLDRFGWNHPVKEPIAKAPANINNVKHRATSNLLWLESTIAMTAGAGKTITSHLHDKRLMVIQCDRR